MTQIGTVIEGKYEILKQVGKGGMSVVYLAMDKKLNKQWAVKEIAKTSSGKNNEIIVNSLLAEANLMKRLDHPALPRIVDIIDNGDTIYIVMDYIEGESLDKILAEYGAQSQEYVINWAKQLCDVLSYLHSQKPPIIYRDMKPANIMLKPEGNLLKVIDFGIAREYKEQNLADTTVLGTRGYAPPEQHGSRQTDARSDIYALGMTMHHLLTGADPRPADYMYMPIRKYNPELSEGLEKIINKCTALDPEDRYQSCAEMMYDLEHYKEIGQNYKKKQKKKLAVFISCASLCIIFALVGAGLKIAEVQVNNSDYQTYVDVVDSTSDEEKLEKYKKAIEIFPERVEAYNKLLKMYEQDGVFTKEESDILSAIYEDKKESLDKTNPQVSELNYEIGRMYFVIYDGTYKAKVEKATGYFKENYDNKQISSEFAKKELSDCYYEVCSFYKSSIDRMGENTLGKTDCEKFLNRINTTISDIQNSSASKTDELSLYNCSFFTVNSVLDTLASVGIEQSEVEDTLKLIYESTVAVEGAANAEDKKLQQEIIDNYSKYKRQIVDKYLNQNLGK